MAVVLGDENATRKQFLGLDADISALLETGQLPIVVMLQTGFVDLQPEAFDALQAGGVFGFG